MRVYAVQVTGGQERCAAGLINRFAADALTQCFVPQNELLKCSGGRWHRVHETLFPGYLFIETRTPELLQRRLAQTPTFTRLLGASNSKFMPLSKDEVLWLETLTSAKTHVLQMSQGVIEGEQVIVTDGPLKGCEAQIKKINRHKRLAWLEMQLFGRTKTIRVGLEIVRKHL